MNAKQLGIIGAILVLCLVGVFLVNSKNRRTLQRPANVLGQKVFPELSEDGALNQVARVVIRDAGSEVTLEKDAEGTWTVTDRGGFPADFDKIRGFLQDVWELEITEAQVVGPSKLDRLELLEPPAEPTAPDPDDAESAGEGEVDEESDGTGTLVVLADAEGAEITRFVLGKTFEGGAATPSPFGFSMGGSQGRFVKTPDSGDNVWMVSEAFTESQPDPADWLAKDFLRVAKPRQVAFTAEDPAESWTLVRTEETGDFTLADPGEDEQLDTAKTGPIKNILANPTFKDVVPDPADESTGLDDPQRFVIDTFEGFHYDVKIGDKTEDGDFHLTFDVSADFPTEYVPEEESGDEASEAEADTTEATPDADAEAKAEEEREQKKKAFELEVERRQDKLAKEKALAGKVYVVNRWALDSVLKKRSELLATPEEEDEAGGAGEGTIPQPGATSSDAGSPSAPAAREPITAVTPPIEVPIPPRDDDAPPPTENPDGATPAEDDEPATDGDTGGEPDGEVGGEGAGEDNEDADPGDAAASAEPGADEAR